MSSKTKIVVLRMKEIIYTAVFIGFGIFLILLLVIMFRPKKDTPASAKGTVYHPGVYSSALHLGSQEVNVEVTVDAVEITGVTLVPLSDSVSAMYPLVAPSTKNLSGQICATQSLKNLTYPQESKYTSQALIRAIERALAKASVSTTETLFPGL